MGKVKELIKDEVIKTSERKISMPKRDYVATMQNDTIYLDKFSTFIMCGIEKMKHLAKKQNIGTDINLMFEYAKIDMEVAEAVSKVNIQTRIMNDKKVHYEKIFLPMYERQVVEMKEKWEETMKSGRDIIANTDISGNKIKRAISKTITDFDNDKYGSKEEEEIKNECYKSIKRMVKLYNEQK